MLELWGGHECTVNRVGDRYFDQTVRTEHQDRISDLELFAELGVKRLRYPVLWERVSPERPDERDFAWTDERLARIRELGMGVIAGLVHHGSGPRYTSLIDDEGFAIGLAAHAAAVAERYPWIDAYTPVNEPLTTARFSALYGHWYPHTTDEAAFWRALLNQIDATRLSMAAIRRINPAAKLVQTDDLGLTRSTPQVAYQSEFDNHRRWITWDLLCGRVVPGHPLHDHIAWHAGADRLKAIADDPCPPDVIGVNHYLTSERFLDHRLSLYPPHLRPGPGAPPFVDVETVRVCESGVVGIEALLAETWDRYGLPIAVTECHNGCTREEQMRWVVETWRACERLQEEGVDVRAVTAWSLLGAVDWVCLLQREQGCYEPGVFDLRGGGSPRPTALAGLWRSLAAGEPVGGVALTAPGWWRRDSRYVFPHRARKVAPCPTPKRSTPVPEVIAGPIVITGATGTLGRAFARACEHRALPFVLTDRRRLPLEDEAAARRMLAEFKPSAVVNTAGFVRVDDAEREVDACMAGNAEGAGRLARACAAEDIPFVTFSSDLVFDGRKGGPYVESDRPNPLNVYGRSKAEAERLVAEAGGRSLIVRTAAFFQAHDPHNFGVHVLNALRAGQPFAAPDDSVVSPTHVPDLVHAVLDLVIDSETGLWHLANPGAASWADFGRMIARAAGLDERRIEGRPWRTFGWPATRPANVALDSTRGRLLPPLEVAIDRFVAEAKPALAESSRVKA